MLDIEPSAVDVSKNVLQSRFVPPLPPRATESQKYICTSGVEFQNKSFYRRSESLINERGGMWKNNWLIQRRLIWKTGTTVYAQKENYELRKCSLKYSRNTECRVNLKMIREEFTAEKYYWHCFLHWYLVIDAKLLSKQLRVWYVRNVAFMLKSHDAFRTKISSLHWGWRSR